MPRSRLSPAALDIFFLLAMFCLLPLPRPSKKTLLSVNTWGLSPTIFLQLIRQSLPGIHEKAEVFSLGLFSPRKRPPVPFLNSVTFTPLSLFSTDEPADPLPPPRLGRLKLKVTFDLSTSFFLLVGVSFLAPETFIAARSFFQAGYFPALFFTQCRRKVLYVFSCVFSIHPFFFWPSY